MTMYFPLVVHGALLIEPTETESKAALDEFAAVVKALAAAARAGDADRFRAAPLLTPRRRLDETRPRASRCCAGALTRRVARPRSRSRRGRDPTGTAGRIGRVRCTVGRASPRCPAEMTPGLIFARLQEHHRKCAPSSRGAVEPRPRSHRMEQPPVLVKPSRRAVLTAATAGTLVPRAVLAQQAPTAPEQTAVPRQRVEAALPQLQQLAEAARQRTGIPGMAIAVVYEDEVIYLEGFGVREEGRPDAVDPDTVFQLASLSKPIAATVVAALVGDGVVGWDDPIIRHDPGFEMYDAWVTRQVTLRDMLAHRSGLPDHAGDTLEDIGYDRAQILYRLRYQKPDSSFRSRYAYTNFGFTEAAIAAAMASGRSWADVSAELLYRPLGMHRTSSRFADFTAAANRASGHVQVAGKWVAKYTRNADAQSPAGGASSSAQDMAMWLRLQLGGGRFAGKQIVAAEPLDETHRPQIVRTPPKNPAVDHAGFYGLGWNIDYDAEGRVHWGHSGGFDLGAATSVSLLPAQRLGIVALTNAQPIGVPEAVSRSFFDIVLTGKVEKDWLALYGQLMAATLAPAYGTAVDYTETASAAVAGLARLGLCRHLPERSLWSGRDRYGRRGAGAGTGTGATALPDAAFRPRRVHLSARRRERRRPERRQLHDRRRPTGAGGDDREPRYPRPRHLRPGSRRQVKAGGA